MEIFLPCVIPVGLLFGVAALSRLLFRPEEKKIERFEDGSIRRAEWRKRIW